MLKKEKKNLGVALLGKYVLAFACAHMHMLMK